MKSSRYIEAIRAAEGEISKLLEKRATIDSRLAKLRRSVTSLSQLLGNSSGWKPSEGMSGVSVKSGLTDAIRKLLHDESPLSTRELRDCLNKEGFNIGAYASRLTIIHNTLKRLQQQGEIDLVKGPNGTTACLRPEANNSGKKRNLRQRDDMGGDKR